MLPLAAMKQLKVDFSCRLTLKRVLFAPFFSALKRRHLAAVDLPTTCSVKFNTYINSDGTPSWGANLLINNHVAVQSGHITHGVFNT